MILEILFSLALGLPAHGASLELVECEPALIAFGALRDRQPHEKQLVGLYEHRKVFIKQIRPSRVDPRLWHDLDLIARILGSARVGPRYHGMTHATPTKPVSMVFDFVEGTLVYYDEVIPEGVEVSAQTLSDVERAVEVLSVNRIIAHDLQFLLTPAGRAVLVDYDQYEFTETEEGARFINGYDASWLLESLRLALRRDRAA